MGDESKAVAVDPLGGFAVCVLDRLGRWKAVIFLRFAAGSAGDQGSLLPTLCLIDIASRIMSVKNV